MVAVVEVRPKLFELLKARFDAPSAHAAKLGRSATDVHKLPQPGKCCAWQFANTMTQDIYTVCCTQLSSKM